MSNLKKICWILAAAAWISPAGRTACAQTGTPSGAEAPRRLTLEECRALALASSREQAIARETSRKADFLVQSYKANYLPRVSASGTYFYSNGKAERTIEGGYLPTFVPGADGTLQPNLLIGPDGQPVMHEGQPVFKEYAYFPGMPLELQLGHTFSAAARLEQPVYMGGKISAAYSLARIGRELAALNEDRTAADVLLRSDEAYWNCVRAQELLSSADKYVETVEAFFKNITDAVEVGMKSRNDALKVQVQLNQARLDRLRVQNALKLARMNLCYVTGLPLNTAVEPAGEPETDAVADLPGDYDIADRPEYGMLSRQIEQKGQEEKLARSEFLPEVGVMASYGYANGLKLNGEKLLDKTSFLGVLSVNIPLFHWGEGRNKIRAARADRNIIALQQEDVRQKMELEIQQAANAFSEARLEVILTEQALEQARENMSESGDRYETGLETVADHLQAQAQWQKARADLIEARAALRLSRTRYLKAAGRLR